jgi:hypothetical protein
MRPICPAARAGHHLRDQAVDELLDVVGIADAGAAPLLLGAAERPHESFLRPGETTDVDQHSLARGPGVTAELRRRLLTGRLQLRDGALAGLLRATRRQRPRHRLDEPVDGALDRPGVAGSEAAALRFRLAERLHQSLLRLGETLAVDRHALARGSGVTAELRRRVLAGGLQLGRGASLGRRVSRGHALVVRLVASRGVAGSGAALTGAGGAADLVTVAEEAVVAVGVSVALRGGESHRRDCDRAVGEEQLDHGLPRAAHASHEEVH